MQQKRTIESLEYHNQFQETPDEIQKSKREKAKHMNRDQKQGQSKYMVSKKIK